MNVDVAQKRIERALDIDPRKIEKKIIDFIRRKVKEARVDGVVIGLSGGIDSAVVATLCVRALGKKKVLGLALPQVGLTPTADVRDAKETAKALGIAFEEIDISPILYAIEKNTAGLRKKPIASANLKPRTRMALLYCYANSLNRLVAGTGNLSELRAGYFTKYGDGGVDILPIGPLYKTQVRKLATHLKVNPRIIKKAPTAGLWKGQTDEGELGITYVKLDKVYTGLELRLSEKAIADAVGVSVEKVKGLVKREKMMTHKLKLPEMPKI
jgi:NAD+ synthase